MDKVIKICVAFDDKKYRFSFRNLPDNKELKFNIVLPDTTPVITPETSETSEITLTPTLNATQDTSLTTLNATQDIQQDTTPVITPETSETSEITLTPTQDTTLTTLNATQDAKNTEEKKLSSVVDVLLNLLEHRGKINVEQYIKTHPNYNEILLTDTDGLVPMYIEICTFLEQWFRKAIKSFNADDSIFLDTLDANFCKSMLNFITDLNTDDFSKFMRLLDRNIANAETEVQKTNRKMVYDILALFKDKNDISFLKLFPKTPTLPR